MLINPGSPLETVLLNSTLSDISSGSAKEESVWKIVLASVCGAVGVAVGAAVGVAVLLLLVKRGVIRKLQTALQHFIISGENNWVHLLLNTQREVYRSYIGPDHNVCQLSIVNGSIKCSSQVK